MNVLSALRISPNFEFIIFKTMQNQPQMTNEIIITNREKEILILIAEGFNTHEIAAKLFIAAHTIATHRKNMVQRNKCHNITQLYKEVFNKDIENAPRKNTRN